MLGVNSVAGIVLNKNFQTPRDDIGLVLEQYVPLTVLLKTSIRFFEEKSFSLGAKLGLGASRWLHSRSITSANNDSMIPDMMCLSVIAKPKFAFAYSIEILAQYSCFAASCGYLNMGIPKNEKTFADGVKPSGFTLSIGLIKEF